MNLYSASSRLLLRSAPDPSTAKKSSFKGRVECVRVNPGEQSHCQWKPIPNRGRGVQYVDCVMHKCIMVKVGGESNNFGETEGEMYRSKEKRGNLEIGEFEICGR